MLKVRTRSSDNIDKRQKLSLAEFAANGVNIPLSGEQWLNRWCTLPITEDFFKRLYEFQVKDDDVYVVTFLKCGTTWIQETTWLLVNNLDFVKSNAEDLTSRSIFMDLSAFYNGMCKDSIDLAEQASSPRVLKTHLPAHLIPKQIWEKKSKIIYCARNPKDMAVSFYHFHRGMGSWQGNINEFVEDLINNDIKYSPYWEHIMDFWRMREEANVCFVTYEDMKRDLRAVLIKLNCFLEKPDLSEEQLQHLEKQLSFEYMKANKHVNLTFSIKAMTGPNVRDDFEFMRRGIVGSHKDELSAETQNKLDAWIAENLEKFSIKLEDIFGSI